VIGIINRVYGREPVTERLTAGKAIWADSSEICDNCP